MENTTIINKKKNPHSIMVHSLIIVLLSILPLKHTQGSIAYFKSNPLYHERTASLFIPFCDQLATAQEDIEGYISINHNGDASNYMAGQATPSATSFNYILGVTPTTLSTTSGCPKILIQLGSGHVDTKGRHVYLDNVKVKSVATCDNDDKIVKWTSHTNLDYRSLSIAVDERSCLNVFYDDDITLN